MSTSLVYHGFGVRGYTYERTDFRKGMAIFRIRPNEELLRCPECGGAEVTRHGGVWRDFRSLPLGSKPVWVQCFIPRVECPHCKITRQISIDFAPPMCRYTKAFERYVLELSRRMTIQDVAEHLGISWDTVKEIQSRYLDRRFGKPKLKHLKRIGIDEISVAKGHRYQTLVLDLDSGAVVFVGDGKGAEALEPFWRRVQAAHAKIEAVAIDMSPAYVQAVSDNLSHAAIVFDRFHVIKLYNEKLSNLRRELYREATEKLHKDVLKGTRWLLLKLRENLDESRNEQQRLEEALKLNEPLALAYYLKEDLNEVWEQEDKEAAQAHLMDWIVRAEASGVRMLKDFAKTLRYHAWGILAYYDYEISTGPLEGTNNKIKTMKRQAYGFRDLEFFKLKILGIHETKYALVG